ncbi:winged helix-turn-helix domain-containing tetratricopeptide repeat protein [Bradyrhizobium brasilense]|uniref:TolB amino-terminal domain-containing protein n=1 Tax=Bradyrhizobium brasilense TaxID=1419277 RepID=A0A1G7B071_9BRAD|nr:winged helix-turn-helix domain-containing protein [Bradyrhizobium brasilense]MCC8973702.1 winged helix-turn-helix domain-containing protein [Bradyrhizobium brasilense]SDE20479.1 TolB amino-terminal domain-containing protein [Bradyrhizobium brasilense]
MPFLFEDYCLDANRRELKRGSELIPVGPKVFDLLLFLVQNREQVVTRDDLLKAVWEGRIVSESTLTSHVNAVRKAIGDTGKEQRLIRTVSRRGLRFVGKIIEQEMPARVSVTGPGTDLGVQDPGVRHAKNIQEPIRAFEVDAPTETRETAPVFAAEAESPPSLPDRPSIAVLPFQNMSGDVEQEYFADGMAEDIITALSRFKAPFVIARNSSFTYKARAVDVKQVGRELGVRYVLEGSVRKAANRVRITGQLVDAATGAHIWADRFDGEFGDIFDLQDQVTESVVGAIAPAVEKAEIDRAKRKPTASLDAYALYLRGLARLHQFGNRHANDEALRLFNRAIELDPEFATAYGRAAFCYLIARINGWIPDTATAIAEVKKLTQRAVELGKDDAIALSAGGNALAFVVGDLEVGGGLVDRAIALNSNLAEASNFGGWVKLWLGEPESAIERFARAIRLSPVDPWLMGMRAGTAYAHFFLDRYDEAASWAAMALQCSPDYRPGLRITAASNAMAGRPEQAHKAVARLRELSPTLRLSNLKEVLGPYRRAEDVARYEEGLRQAGLPE